MSAISVQFVCFHVLNSLFVHSRPQSSLSFFREQLWGGECFFSCVSNEVLERGSSVQNHKQTINLHWNTVIITNKGTP